MKSIENPDTWSQAIEENSRFDELEKMFRASTVHIEPKDDGRVPTKEELRKWARFGNMAVSIDTQKGEIYIGNDHRGMTENRGIPENDMAGAITKFDEESGELKIRDLIDWRKKKIVVSGEIDIFGTIHSEILKNIVAKKIHEFLFVE